MQLNNVDSHAMAIESPELHADLAFGKRRDSSTTITQHDFARPQIKSESTPTSPTWRNFPRHGQQEGSPPLVESSYAAALSSPPSLPSRSISLPQTPNYPRAPPPPHHQHLAHSVRMIFSMTPINSRFEPGAAPPPQHVPLSSVSQPYHVPSGGSTSSGTGSCGQSSYTGSRTGTSTPFSYPSSRAGSPPILLPPLSSSTPRSAATTVSSRAPSPLGPITLPPLLKVHSPVALAKNGGHVSVSGGGGVPVDGSEENGTSMHHCHEDGVMVNAVDGHHSNHAGIVAGGGERVRLPRFSEIIRGSDS
jgi:hypothetical protein